METLSQSKKMNIEKIPQKSGETLTQLVSTDVWVGREKQTITKPKERIPSSNLVTKKYCKKKSNISKKCTSEKTTNSGKKIPDAVKSSTMIENVVVPVTTPDSNDVVPDQTTSTLSL